MKLTENEWSQVFQLRCRSKQGQYLPPEAHALMEAACKEDFSRYSAMAEGVFNATVPFGSHARWGQKKKTKTKGQAPVPEPATGPMKKYLFLGDTHNDLDFAESAAKLARESDAEVIQLGDWGYIWPDNSQLDDLSSMLVGLGVTMRFIDGNHDVHPALKKLCGRVRAKAVTIAPNVIYQPRGSVHEDSDGTRFLFLGGAPSIDRASRKPGFSWWPEEIITDAQSKLALSAKGPIHVICTHDAPAYPPDFAAKGTPGYIRDQLRSMKIVDALIKKHRPLKLLHGHWHVKYEFRHAKGTLVTGLDCNQLDHTYLDDSTLLWSRDQEERSAP